MNVEYINPFTQATFDVLTMFGTFDPKLGKPFVKDDALISVGVVVVVGIIGEVKGQVAYSFSEETAKMIASTMMMGMPVSELDEMSTSAISELGNMIMGNAATLLSTKGIGIDITPPTLSHGEVSFTNNFAKTLCVPMAFADGSGSIDLFLALRQED